MYDARAEKGGRVSSRSVEGRKVIAKFLVTFVRSYRLTRLSQARERERGE